MYVLYLLLRRSNIVSSNKTKSYIVDLMVTERLKSFDDLDELQGCALQNGMTVCLKTDTGVDGVYMVHQGSLVRIAALEENMCVHVTQGTYGDTQVVL